MSSSTPPVVTLVAHLEGRSRTMPQQDGRITRNELQSLDARLHQLIILTAHLTDTIEHIRKRALREQGVATGSTPVPAWEQSLASED